KTRKPIRTRLRDMILTRRDLRRASPTIARGGVIGFLIGVLPGAGSTLAAFFAYDAEKRITKDNSKFGKGEIRGVAAPEAATNASEIGRASCRERVWVAVGAGWLYKRWS